MTEPAWMRYATDPDALRTICLLHAEQANRDPKHAAELLAEVDEIDTYLSGTARS